MQIRSREDERKIAIQVGCTQSKAGETMGAHQKTAVGDVEFDAAVEVAVKEAADGNGSGTTGLEAAGQKLSGLPGGEDTLAKQDVLIFDVHLGSVEDLLGWGLAVIELVHVGPDELATDLAGDGTKQISYEEEAVFQDANDEQIAVAIVARDLPTEGGDALPQLCFGDDESKLAGI